MLELLTQRWLFFKHLRPPLFHLSGVQQLSIVFDEIQHLVLLNTVL